jgi:ribosome modulation factor
VTADEARRYAARRWPRSIGFQEAFLAGYRARRARRSIDACPYATGDRRRARSGWRPIWRSVWIEGWRAGA